jgi:uncharacterized protein (DUF2336 family)
MPETQRSLINDLERALSGKQIGDRAVTLRRVTDLFVGASGHLSDDQVALFDDVMSRLLREVETSARASFAHLLAGVTNAPAGVVRSLALDDAIDVAGPVLTHAERIDESTLVEGARTKSQAHLLAISRRKVLAEAVTDVLVERGDREVALSTAGNPGAAFSEFGYSTLVLRSTSDEALATSIWQRPEIPRRHLLKLFADASEAVKRELTAQDPTRARDISDLVMAAAQQIQTRAREHSPQFDAAYGNVQWMHAAGTLDEAALGKFAAGGRFDETVVALSFMCDLPIALIERAMVDPKSEQLVLVARAAGLSWDTVKAMLSLQERPGTDAAALEHAHETFTNLNVEAAKKAIQFYRLRQRAAAKNPA